MLKLSKEYVEKHNTNSSCQKTSHYGGERQDHFSDFCKQKQRCAICATPLPFNGGVTGAVLDHCHTSGEFRGFLCGSCNRGLGLFKDNPDVLKSAGEYLQKHRDKSVFWKRL